MSDNLPLQGPRVQVKSSSYSLNQTEIESEILRNPTRRIMKQGSVSVLVVALLLGIHLLAMPAPVFSVPLAKPRSQMDHLTQHSQNHHENNHHHHHHLTPLSHNEIEVNQMTLKQNHQQQKQQLKKQLQRGETLEISMNERNKRSGISDQRLAELEEMLRIEMIRAAMRNSHPVAYGLFDPMKIGRRRKRHLEASDSKTDSDSDSRTDADRKLDHLVELLLRAQEHRRNRKQSGTGSNSAFRVATAIKRQSPLNMDRYIESPVDRNIYHLLWPIILENSKEITTRDLIEDLV